MKLTSLKTTTAGIINILIGLGMLGNVAQNLTRGEALSIEQATVAIGLITGGIGMIFARDNSTSSEQAGAVQ